MKNSRIYAVRQNSFLASELTTASSKTLWPPPHLPTTHIHRARTKRCILRHFTPTFNNDLSTVRIPRATAERCILRHFTPTFNNDLSSVQIVTADAASLRHCAHTFINLFTVNIPRDGAVTRTWSACITGGLKHTPKTTSNGKFEAQSSKPHITLII